MADELATLIRLARLQLDEKRKVLAAIVAEEDRLKEQKTQLLARLEEENRSTPPDFEADLSRGNFIKASLEKRDRLDAQLRQIATLIAAAQDEVRKAFEEVKRYEIAEETHRKREAKEARRRETKALDEVGSDRFQRERRGESE